MKETVRENPLLTSFRTSLFKLKKKKIKTNVFKKQIRLVLKKKQKKNLF